MRGRVLSTLIAFMQPPSRNSGNSSAYGTGFFDEDVQAATARVAPFLELTDVQAFLTNNKA